MTGRRRELAVSSGLVRVRLVRGVPRMRACREGPVTSFGAQELTTSRDCRVPGCELEDAGKGGPWAGYCQEHIRVEMKKRHAKRSKTIAAQKTKAASEPTKRKARPKQESAPPPAPASNGSLTDLARKADEAHAAWKAALDDLRRAVEAAG